MGYKPMTEEKVYQIFRRHHEGQRISEIKAQENIDRKTIRYYLAELSRKGFTRENTMPDREKILSIIREIIPQRRSPRTSADILVPYLDELKALLGDKEGVIPKTAFEIIQHRDGLDVSYESFKRFARTHSLTAKERPQFIRIEMPPGVETQIDYGKVGQLFDATQKRNRVVYAFCGILSHSRLPFIQFVFTQDKRSFVMSIVDMFEYYGGVTESLSLDNLKSGVVKPDLWDPSLNTTCAEMADHYGVFIDPCRVATPTDKGKVERFVQVSRELFRKLKTLHPTADIYELNRLALTFCSNEYGQREHGTTKQAPMTVFENFEKAMLKKLPEVRFDCPLWKEVSVHPDQFFSYAKKRYSLPAAYRCKKVWIRENGSILKVFCNHELIREYVITSKVRHWVPEDFPETIREMMDGGYPRYLLDQSRPFGDDAYRLIQAVLSPHAYLNSRRAQGMLRAMGNHAGRLYFNEVCIQALSKGVKLPKTLTHMFESASEQLTFDYTIEMSDEGRAMVRPVMDFIH
jgi:transposase